MNNLQPLMTLLRQAASLLMGLHRDQWVGWIIYLLEVLQDETKDDNAEFEDVLISLRNALSKRLDAGEW